MKEYMLLMLFVRTVEMKRLIEDPNTTREKRNSNSYISNFKFLQCSQFRPRLLWVKPLLVHKSEMEPRHCP